MSLNKNGWLGRWMCSLLALFFVGQASALQISLTSGTNFYTDFSSAMRAGHVSLAITNNDGVVYSNLWMTLGSFTNTSLRLGGGDPGRYSLGTMTNNNLKPAFYYLEATNDPGTTAAYNNRFTVQIYKGFPTTGTLLVSSNFTVFVQNSSQNSANKVTSVAYAPTNNPVLGGIFKVSVFGNTGNVANGQPLVFTGAAFTNWNAGAFQLVACSMAISNGVITDYFLTNTLATASAAHITGTGDPYEADYWFRTIATTPTSTPVSPVSFLQNGGSVLNHCQQTDLLALAPVLPATNQTLMTSLVAATQLYTNQTVTFTMRVTNASIFDVTLDRFVDTLPTNFVYVTGSSTFGGISILDATNVSQTLVWSQNYFVPAGTSRDLVFQAVPTGFTVNTSTTNYCVAYVQNSQIDTTLNTADNAPATETVRVLIAPVAANVTGVALENQTLSVAAPGVLANTVEPNNFTATIISYTQPAHGSVTVGSDGSYAYLPAAFYWGADSFTFTLTNQNGRASTATNNLTVTWVNQPPYFTKGTDQTVLEDATAQSISGWGTAISAGTNDPVQTLSFRVSNNNSNLFSVQPAVSSGGTLTYTPAANANGSATVSVYLQDNGGTANGGVDSSPVQTFTITVTTVNDAPNFTKGANQTVLEDAAAQTVANWATGISAGPADEAVQTLSFRVSNNNSNLFSVQPAVSSGGTLTYTPAANANGSATVSVYLQDNGGTANGGVDSSPVQTFTITVTAVNDAPTLNALNALNLNEDAGQQTVNLSGIAPGPADETGQTLTVTAISSNPSLIPDPTVTYTSPSSTGTLQFTPVADSNGVATVMVIVTDNDGVANGGVNSVTNTFTVTVTAINDPPSFTKGANQIVLEDAGAQVAAGWATAINAGPADESGQTVNFFVSNNSSNLFSVQPAVSSVGTLTYTPAANANGTATVTIYAQDNGGTASGGSNTSASQTFTITITAVNDAPTLNAITNVTLTENWNPQTMDFNGVTVGPTNEFGQTLTVTAVSSNPLLVPNPTVTYTSPGTNGTLAFTPATNSFGTATITVVVQDNGGTASGGVDAVTNIFLVTVQGMTNYWFGGSNLTVNLLDATGNGGVSQTNYTGVLSVPATSTNPFTIKVAGLAANFSSASNYSWTIATTTRGVIGWTTNQFIFDTSAFTNDLAGGYFTVVLSGDGSTVNLVFTGNSPPVAGPAAYARAFNAALRIPINNLLTNYTGDPNGDARLLVGVGGSTNGAYLSTNSLYILFASTNNVTESFPYIVRDARNYRPGDTVYYATNWITIVATPTVGYANTITANGNGSLTIKFVGIPNYAYDVERAPVLSGPWSVVLTTNAPPNGIWLYTDTNPPQPSAFYRTKQH